MSFEVVCFSSRGYLKYVCKIFARKKLRDVQGFLSRGFVLLWRYMNLNISEEEAGVKLYISQENSV
jgi:hypothetical protein